MRILIAHNRYQQPGGEDAVFEAEANLLEQRGHCVTRYVVHNDQINGMNRLKLIGATFRNRDVCGELHALALEKDIQVAHFHNTFPLISPAAYGAVRSAGAAVVQTLHNHRLICPNALLYRDGHVCTDCVGRSIAWPGILHGCYRGSRPATATVALLQTVHGIAGTYQRQVDLYIVPSKSTADRLASAGLPSDRVAVKPHFVDPDPGAGAGAGGYAVFVGRLSTEKGLQTLLNAWALLRRPQRLIVIGDGPLSSLMASVPPSVEWVGRQPPHAVARMLGDAAMLIFPSECHETFGRTIIEAFAAGTPVIASNLGAAPEIVEPGGTGVLFKAGDAPDLAGQVDSLYADPQRLAAMRSAARAQYEAHYTASHNYGQLIELYGQAIEYRRCNETQQLHHDQLGRRQPA